MAKFKINLSGAIAEKENFKLKLDDYVDTSVNIFDNVKKSKNVWTDPASYGFNGIVLDDESKAKDVVSTIKSHYNNLDFFIENLSDIFRKREYDLTEFTIDYDATYMNLSLSSINTVIGDLKSTKEYCSSPDCPSGFEYKSEVDNYVDDIDSIIGEFNSFYSDINNIYTEINDIVVKCDEKHRSIEFAGINGVPTRFVWSLVSTLKQQEYELVGATKLDVLSNNVSLNNTNKVELSGTTVSNTTTNVAELQSINTSADSIKDRMEV